MLTCIDLIVALGEVFVLVGFAGLFVVMVGCALVTPAAALVLLRPLHPIAGVVFGLLGRLATRSDVRDLFDFARCLRQCVANMSTLWRFEVGPRICRRVLASGFLLSGSSRGRCAWIK